MNMGILFALEGIFLQFTGAINGFGNNLFATNLGATDAQIGLMQMVPNLASMILLLPLGILADKTKNIRMIPIFTLAAMAFGYLGMTAVPMTDGMRMPLFFLALTFTVGGSVLYNAQWQNFFGEVISYGERNRILTYRNLFMFVIGIIAPVMAGIMLSSGETAEAKLSVFQEIFFVCAIVTILQIIVLCMIRVPKRTVPTDAITINALKEAIAELSHNVNFMLFFVPVVFFYMTWQLDWSMWYIGQTQYLGMNENDLSVCNGVFNIGQLFAIAVFSRIIQKKGTDYTVCFAGLGLLLCPICILLVEQMPAHLHAPGLTAFVTLVNAGQCTLNLCIVQILLRVAPMNSKSLAISLYSLTIALTNSFMPYVGVRIYTAFGAGHRGFVMFNLLVVFLRCFSFAGLVGRYLYLKNRTHGTMLLN